MLGPQYRAEPHPISKNIAQYQDEDELLNGPSIAQTCYRPLATLNFFCSGSSYAKICSLVGQFIPPSAAVGFLLPRFPDYSYTYSQTILASLTSASFLLRGPQPQKCPYTSTIRFATLCQDLRETSTMH